MNCLSSLKVVIRLLWARVGSFVNMLARVLFHFEPVSSGLEKFWRPNLFARLVFRARFKLYHDSDCILASNFPHSLYCRCDNILDSSLRKCKISWFFVALTSEIFEVQKSEYFCRQCYSYFKAVLCLVPGVFLVCKARKTIFSDQTNFVSHRNFCWILFFSCKNRVLNVIK